MFSRIIVILNMKIGTFHSINTQFNRFNYKVKHSISPPHHNLGVRVFNDKPPVTGISQKANWKMVKQLSRTLQVQTHANQMTLEFGNFTRHPDPLQPCVTLQNDN